MPSTIYLGSDGTITVTGLTQQPAGTAVTGATVTGVLKSASGSTVWASVNFVDEGSGTYSASFPAANVPPLGTYSLTVTATKSGMTLVFEHDIIVQPMTV